jgi:hypothetical protein
MTEFEKVAVDEFDRQIKIIEDATNDKALSDTGRANIVAIADSAALTAQRIASRIRALAATPAVVILPREKSDRVLKECGYSPLPAAPPVTEDELTEIMDKTWPDGHRAAAKKIIERLSAKETSE